MKVLLLNRDDGVSGSGIATLRYALKLREKGIDVKIGVLEKYSTSDLVIKLPRRENILLKIKDFIFKCISKQFYHSNTSIPYSLNLRTKIDLRFINSSDYDLIHIGWINGMLDIESISKINKSIIWTLHDSWPFCGIEHHPNVLTNDRRYIEGYTLKNKPADKIGIDLPRIVWRKKKKYLMNKDITFIAPSEFMKNALESSYLFNRNRCYLIPNFVEDNIFKIYESLDLKNILGIPRDVKVLGFGAAYGMDTPKSIKGTFELLQALEKIQEREKYFLLVFGDASSDFLSKIHIKYFSSGFIKNKQLLAILYNICDCFINPSLVESFGFTTLEAISCGVPVVAFNHSGTKDIIINEENGLLVPPYDIEGFASAIKQCCDFPFNRELISKKAHEKYSADNIVNLLIETYQKATE